MNWFFHGGWNEVRYEPPPAPPSWWRRWLRLDGVSGERLRRLW